MQIRRLFETCLELKQDDVEPVRLVKGHAGQDQRRVLVGGDNIQGIGYRDARAKLQGARVAKYLLGLYGDGKEMELLICSPHVTGVSMAESARKEVGRQLAGRLLVAVRLGWVFLPLAAASFIFIRRSYAIYSF